MAFRYLLFVFFLIIAPGAFTQERAEFFAAPVAEAGMYSREGIALGGGAMLGYGENGKAIGIRACYSTSADLRTLEATIFLRFYLMNREDNDGLFLQAESGAAMFGRGGYMVPMEINAISLGIVCGWRFIIWNPVFFECAVQAGYPNLFSARLCMGVRF